MYAGWWFAWAGAQTLVLHRLGLSWAVSLQDASISTVLLAVAGLVTITLYRFYQPGKSNRIYRFVFGIIIASLYCAALKWILLSIIEDPAYSYFVDKSMPLRFVFSLLIISFLTILNWLLNTLYESKQKELQKNEVERMMKESELSKLRQQLQPHFLFNSLNSINALVVSKPDEARKMIQQLSDFLRGTLRKDDQELVKLKDELDHLRLYLEIEKVRFGHRLNIQIDHNDEVLNNTLPPLLLQPVVENAIKFGLYDVPGEVTISISCKSVGDLQIEVKNPFDPANQKQGTGFGLSSIQRRLYLLYMRNDLLKTSCDEHNFITTLTIPQTK
jgi:LytS/YehU family sensor histidine kinase